jgi:hypothetical protein
VLGNRPIRPPLTVERPDLFIGGEPPCPALRRPCLSLRRRRTRGNQDSSLAIRLDDAGAAQHVTHRFERVPVGAEDLVERFGEVL